MDNMIPIVLILVVVQWILGKTIRKKVDYDGSMIDTDGFALYFWSLLILSIGIIVCLFFIYGTQPLFGLLLMLVFSVRAVFEWIYLRNTKKYIVSLLMVAASLIVTVIFFII
jgi:hypothetical protein